MKFLAFIVSIISLLLVFSACESFQDGPLATDQEQGNLLKPGEPSSTAPKVKVCKTIYEGSQVEEILWDDSHFSLPDFESQAFTIISVEVCLVSENETALLSAKMFGVTCSTVAADCQLPAVLCWQGEYPEEHPFYNGFSIHVTSSEVLEDVEAVCSITYILH